MSRGAEGEIIVVRTGTANLASVLAALERCGASSRLGDRPEEVATAAGLVLPGVGTFAAIMKQLQSRGLVEVIRERIAAGRPTLGICLGMQVLAAASEESPGVTGLAVLPMRVTRLDGGVRVPQLGWNRVVTDAGCRLLSNGAAYFANSYCLRQAPPGWSCAWSVHGSPFIAAMEQGSVVACQLHPELSGQWGHDLLRRWLATIDPARQPAEEVAPC